MDAYSHTGPDNLDPTVTRDGELAKKLALMFVDFLMHHCVATVSDGEVGKNLSLDMVCVHVCMSCQTKCVVKVCINNNGPTVLAW